MQKNPEIKKETDSPVTKAVKSLKIRNKHFIRIPRFPDEETDNLKEIPDVKTGQRGIVYLGHLPKGFYEDELSQYFSQFGKVTRIKLARSRKSGRSMGYAFIEFRFSEVAKIVAETMNNYLLFDRLLKANYVDKTYPASFWYKAATSETYPGVHRRRKNSRIKNSKIAPAKEKKRSQKNMKRLNATLRKLKDKGINYDVRVDDLVAVDKKIDLNDVPVLEVDESDVEIEFKVPSYFIRKSISKKDSPEGKQLQKKKEEDKSPPLSPLVEDKCSTQISLAQTLKQKQNISEQKSVKRKLPLRAKSAPNVKSEPKYIIQRNGKSPLKKKAESSKDVVEDTKNIVNKGKQQPNTQKNISLSVSKNSKDMKSQFSNGRLLRANKPRRIVTKENLRKK